VEAALTNDPEDQELLKLQKDLQQVIELTNDLIQAQTPAAVSQDPAEQQEPVRDWQVGDKCSAVWSDDGQLYNACVDELTSDGQVMVHFVGFRSSEVTRVNLLRDPLPEPAADEQAESSSKNNRRSKDQQEYLKKKKQKKQQRFKEMEEVREDEKNKWQQFNSKVNKKKKSVKGYTKSSIFKTPEAWNGKVGVGTCGIGGKPMTSFTTADKWKRGI